MAKLTIDACPGPATVADELQWQSLSPEARAIASRVLFQAYFDLGYDAGRRDAEQTTTTTTVRAHKEHR